MLATYNFKEVATIMKGVPLTGFHEGSVITLEYDEDDWIVSQGSDGNVMRSRKPNTMAEVELTFQQTSNSNDILSGFRVIDRTTGFGTGAFMLKDLRGRTVITAPNSFIMKPPTIEFGDEGTGRTWRIKLVDAVIFVGGNTPNIPGVA